MATAGPNSASTIADVSGVGTRTWSNPTNAASQNDSYATVSGPNSGGSPFISHWLKFTGFGFSIPSGTTINGIKVEIDRNYVEDFGTPADNALRLVRAGVIESVNHSSPGWQQTSSSLPNNDTNLYDVIGSSADLWGAAWSYSDINDSGFGFALSVSMGKNDVVYVDHVRITIDYSVAGGGLFSMSRLDGLTSAGPTNFNRLARSRPRLWAPRRPQVLVPALILGV